jgi:sphingomyelin phosphodiesterase
MLPFRFCVLFLLAPVSFTVVGSPLDEILTALGNAVDCGSCHALLVPLQVLALLGDSAFVDTIITLCHKLKVSTTNYIAHLLTNVRCIKLEDNDVCDGVIGEQGPIIAQDLRRVSTSGQTGTLICDALFGLCQPPAVNSYTVPIPSTVPPNPKIWKSSGQVPFQVLHFSDVHIDRQYTVNFFSPVKNSLIALS